MYKPVALSPMVPSFNVEITRSFFIKHLNFELALNDPEYSIVKKNEFTIHIMKAGNNISEMSFYLEVENLKNLIPKFQMLKSQTKTKGPIHQPYGMTEYHIIVPETKTLLFVGQVEQKC
jgi:hypothetical protein